MVFHYTNFVQETNAWWLRRVRPVYCTVLAYYGWWLYDRYYLFGKNATQDIRKDTTEVWEKRAALNKRNWGYNAHYKPELERSMKKVLYADPNYKFPIEWPERYMAETKTLEQVMDEEENWEYYK
ncbi:transmembrane protein, putative (macronuclear) [Tetrahymena thermophila SB210]|uniref:Transmembrane protein, putative n=1 Tax=Tetrahymena thermophila (strain SB210) TaxID=312017 RepID=Q23TE5_TETTS|nr:transmembrane protein, putative [Tetrahymena thermophila SB210]7W5Z_W Chain W, Transmembrane protein, putative [Tetrahymena thermophila]7W5Z_w Chain w, Transmembrane protein, putative [Tetrahymena thermophila]8B6H_EO Chain EO, Transmembrane protein, putative [Tetrahymena thermophila SB210]8B6H_Eo Chain Eo, Transmembrane protein, putative [Tetrahymena thermophila SB210]8BQS_EO Chain EO, Transmembrane protein, putative [Tetrahymena thermophila SB210]8BQS_Eo Chain Eo, Transmembrane protein, p|eukprot:XP_001020006.1 transmembrane protein, putative [Tetrahymena thermophila SB210]